MHNVLIALGFIQTCYGAIRYTDKSKYHLLYPISYTKKYSHININCWVQKLSTKQQVQETSWELITPLYSLNTQSLGALTSSGKLKMLSRISAGPRP